MMHSWHQMLEKPCTQGRKAWLLAPSAGSGFLWRIPSGRRHGRALKHTAFSGGGQGQRDLSPEEALLEALRENGLAPEAVRLRGRGWGGAAAGDDDDEEETWEDVITEGEDPWLRNPVALEEDALGFAGLLLGAEEGGGPDPAAAAARAYEAAAAGSVAWGELQRRWAADGSAWTVLDVRKDPEAVPRPPPGSIWLPLERLDKQAVAGLGCARLAVLATGDLRGQQACVRLRDVFGCSETVLVTEWER